MPEPTPEAWAQIRHAYEHTDKPLAHICADNDITIPMLRYRMKRWDWTRRKPLIPREGPPPEAAMQREIAAPHHPTPPAFAPALAGDPPPPEPAPGRVQARPGWEGEEAIVPRLQSAVARVLPAIEATLARLSADAHHPREMEQAGRTLSALTRTLRELNGLLAEQIARPAAASAANDYYDTPQDMDAFREELAQRIEKFIASRGDDAYE